MLWGLSAIVATCATACVSTREATCATACVSTCATEDSFALVRDVSDVAVVPCDVIFDDLRPSVRQKHSVLSLAERVGTLYL